MPVNQLPTITQTVAAGIKLGTPGNVPNNPRDQALAQVSQGLRNDVPFGIGRIMEAFAQAEYDATGQQVRLDGKNAKETQALVQAGTTAAGVQRAADDALFGFQSLDNATNLVWNWNTSNDYFHPAWQLLQLASWGGGILSSQALLRLKSSVNFLTLLNFVGASEGFPDSIELNDAGPHVKTSYNESDIDMLNRIYPGLPWVENMFGTQFCGMVYDVNEDNVPRIYFYSPPPPSIDELLKRFYHLWDFEPVLGGGTQNGIDQFKTMLALIPVHY